MPNHKITECIECGVKHAAEVTSQALCKACHVVRQMRDAGRNDEEILVARIRAVFEMSEEVLELISKRGLS